MMRGIYLGTAEIEALHGAGPLATAVYINLRAWADLRTCTVGRSRAISLSMLRSYCESHIPKGSGHQVVQPSERNVRTALAALVRAGLIERIDDPLRLVFRLSIVMQERCVQNEPDANPRGVPDRVADGLNPAAGAGFSESAEANPQGVKRANATHINDQSRTQTSNTTTYPNVVQAAPSGVVGLSSEGEKLAAALRAEGVRVRPDDPAVEVMVRQGLALADLRAAVAQCRKQRATEGSGQPISAGFLLAVHRGLQAQGRGLDDDAVLAKGQAVGIDARPGESWAEYRKRLASALQQAA